MARAMISATVFAIAFARSSARTFTVVNDWNAVTSGRHTTAKSLSHCEKLCDVPCTQWSFNLHSNHCYTSKDSHFGGSKSDHVVSGCIADLVNGCPTVPVPAPAPSPNPSPAHLPTWSAPQPDPKKPLGGYSKLNVTWVSKIHHGDRDPPLGHGNGTYNHNVMAAYAEGSGFAVSWKNCQTDEDCNGQRMLISLSVNGTPGTWSKVPLLLFPNLTVDGGPQATMEPGPPVHINGRLYFAGSPGLHNTSHDASAQGSQFCLWPDPLEPRNCG